MINPMVERVTAALREYYLDDDKRNGAFCFIAEAEAMARAAIGAMREPSEEMIDAATQDFVAVTQEHKGQRCEASEGLLDAQRGAPQQVWAWMIDAAIADAPEDNTLGHHGPKARDR